jgi:hypothetical protein
MKSDIEIKNYENATIIASKKGFLSYAKKTNFIVAFSSHDLTMVMLDELENSKIICVESYKEGSLLLKPKFGYSDDKLTKVIVNLFEKHEL